MRSIPKALPLVVALALAGSAIAATGTVTKPSNTIQPAAKTGLQLTPKPVTDDGSSGSGDSALVPSNQTSGAVASGQRTSGVNAAIAPGVTNPGIATAGTVGAAEAGLVATEVISANGERIPVITAATVLQEPATTAAPAPQLTPAERAAAQRMRATTARKGQLMHSITPRTENDKSDQMPDDPISPALRR